MTEKNMRMSRGKHIDLSLNVQLQSVQLKTMTATVNICSENMSHLNK